MKFLSSFLLSLIVCVSVNAQQRSQGVEYFILGEYDLAKEALSKEIATNPGEAYYLLGEIALIKGNKEEAKANYEKGAQADADSPYPAIGLSKLAYKDDPKGEDKNLENIMKKHKKEFFPMLEVARAYLYNEKDIKAERIVDDAYKEDKKSPWVYILRGDMAVLKDKVGEAGGQYDQAMNFDPSNALAYIKSGKLYEHTNKEFTLNMYKKALEARPDYVIIYKYLGDINFRTLKYEDAIAAYQKFFDKGTYTIDDLKNYAASLYFSANYDKAKTLIGVGLEKSPDNFVLNRLLMYLENENKEYASALEQANKFFSLPTDTTNKYIAQDYLAYGNILGNSGEQEKALEQIYKAVDLDSTLANSLLDMSKSYAADKMYAEAGLLMKKFIEKGDPTKIDGTSYFQMGQHFLSAGEIASRDTADVANHALVKVYIKEADEAFAKVSELVPESYLGYYWRARAASVLDPALENGLAKPYYEATIKVLEADTESKNDKILGIAYQYLAVFYTYQYGSTSSADDKGEAINYAQKALSVNAEDATAKQIIEMLNPQQ